MSDEEGTVRYILMPRRPEQGMVDQGPLGDFLQHFDAARSTSVPLEVPLQRFVEGLNIAAKQASERFGPPLPEGILESTFETTSRIASDRDVLHEVVRVIDSQADRGTKLIELSPAAAQTLSSLVGEQELAPLIEYRLAGDDRFTPKLAPTSVGGASLRLQVRCAVSGGPISGVAVAAYTDFAKRCGAASTSDANGDVALALGQPALKVDRLLLAARESNHWGRCLSQVLIQDKDVITLSPAQSFTSDALRHFYPPATGNRGKGVKIAVVDTGIDAHPDLFIAGQSFNTVQHEPKNQWCGNGNIHGTHIAGIIGGRGSLVAGLAPDAEIASYRVFGVNAKTATNYSVGKAIYTASFHEGCHLINLSMIADPTDDAYLSRDLDVAVDNGAVVIAAAGNDWGSSIGFPARHRSVLAVTAFGRIGAFPSDGLELTEMAAASATDPNVFFAAFSNVGSRGTAAVIGPAFIAPGVGIVSAAGKIGYRPMSGTSQATAVVTGAAAALISDNLQIMQMPAERSRSNAICNFLFGRARPMGFAMEYEGHGCL